MLPSLSFPSIGGEQDQIPVTLDTSAFDVRRFEEITRLLEHASSTLRGYG